ncbi:MAG: 3D-(3,5/4)-trihydroxycyclohexane-1,2-dione acylhydrolase (decyclizing) [Acidimicrobiaceae bacterium]|nr:3D-(3,5/4)-trihydroxycyclohexane-1,2-dione acylhydrolase (decyclizing) [Acidimicrobiaceae bacterium]MCY4280043.1 3D-(3,5/4)-trihydroxycyclohexane-1,2-dione acylhydrolase (decyclizing) [Acidimicrobiaceae bacterium]MCY4294434.1 3D-(3,5/4)-trihydroxycyclohexane-1,2-dione acylhydrolase (decyclizing) [Acidimicrobiaceae bacterium]
MDTVRLTAAAAIVRYLAAQRVAVDDEASTLPELAPDDDGAVALFAGVFAIFGHGNVTCLGHELETVGDMLPTWRGQNEQGMALAACGFARACKRRRIMVATSSIGPGATNMVTAAAVALANRLPLLLLAGDTFNHRIVDPVLQQVEHFGAPSTTANDAFRAVVRYWDRITAPEQLVQSLPNAVETMLDPGDCGPAFIALPQDVQAQAYDFPVRFFEERVHRVRRPRPDSGELRRAAAAIRSARRPLIIAGGGVRWSLAEKQLADFAAAHGIPVVETTAGRTSLRADHHLNCGPIGVTGCESANTMAAEADLILAVGTRLQDFTTGSWTVFGDETARIIGLNAARFDAAKHLSLPLVADAREGLSELGAALSGYRAPRDWSQRAAATTSQYHAYIDKIAAPADLAVAAADSEAAADPHAAKPTYAQVVGVLDRAADDSTYVVAAAGGLPGELLNGWRAKSVHSFDCEYGYSCMGYEISGAWGAKMALGGREVVALVGDGSYLMMNSDLYSTVLCGHKLIVIVCDNGGYAVIDRLQVNQGAASFNNLLEHCRIERLVPVDFAAHAASMGACSEAVSTIAGLEEAFGRARACDRSYVIVVSTHPHSWTEGGAFWEVGVPETSGSASVLEARAAMDAGRAAQRVGW